MKGWFERVLLPGVAYDEEKYLNKGLLKGKKAMIITTMASPENEFAFEGSQGMSLNDLLHHYNYIAFGFCGIEALPPFGCYAADHCEDSKRKEYLETFKQKLEKIQELEPLIDLEKIKKC